MPTIVYPCEFGAWPALIPGAFALLALVAFVLHAQITPLSNEGVRRRQRWREFGRQLKLAAEHPAPVFGTPFALLPYAVALGAGSAWAKRLKRERLAAPGWFHSAGDEDACAAFVAAAGTRTPKAQ